MALLVKVERFNRLLAQSAQIGGINYQVYQTFNALLEEHYRSQHDVNFYAKLLNLSAPQLSKLLQQVIGKSAKRLILERNLLEAKRYLQFTDFSIKEIAIMLGYADPYHFSKLFKQTEKVAPQSYREQWLKK